MNTKSSTPIGSKCEFSKNAEIAAFAKFLEFADFAEYIEKEVKAAPQNKKVNTLNTKSSTPIC